MGEVNLAEYLNYKQNLYTEEKQSSSKKKFKNKNFAQISTYGMDYLMQLGFKSPTALSVFLLLVKHMEQNNTCMMPQAFMMEKLNTNRRQTISDAVKMLLENGYMKKYVFRNLNVYFINPYIACNTNAAYKRKLMRAYYDLEGYPLIGLDRSVISTVDFDKEEHVKFRWDFYNMHTELHSPTDEEVEHMMIEDEVTNRRKDNLYEDNFNVTKSPVRTREAAIRKESMDQYTKIKQLENSAYDEIVHMMHDDDVTEQNEDDLYEDIFNDDILFV